MGQSKSVLNQLQGKTVCLHGKFSYGMEDRLKALAEAQGATVVADLDPKVDHLVLEDTTGGVTIQKKALALNAKGAAIQVLQADAFEKRIAPTEADVLALIKGGKKNAELMEVIAGPRRYQYAQKQSGPMFTYTNENFDGLDLTGMTLSHLSFEQCSFVGAKLAEAGFGFAKNCDFSKCQGKEATFDNASGSRFAGADMPQAQFGMIERADFSDARMEEAEFTQNLFHSRKAKPPSIDGLVFRKAFLKGAKFVIASFNHPDFQDADLTGAQLLGSEMPQANFKGSTLNDASLVGGNLRGANFTRASLKNANLADADLTDAIVDSADLAGTNLRGATTKGVHLAKAKNVTQTATGIVGPALTELNTLAASARKIHATFKLSTGTGDDGEQVGINSSSFKWGWGVQWPYSIHQHQTQQPNQTFSDALMQLANTLGHKKVRYETVEVDSTKSPKGGKDLRELILKAIEEAFAQPMPPEADLAAATKLFREADREKNAAAREKREEAKAAAEKVRVAEVKKAEKKIEKAVGKVTDIATFLKALELRIEAAKISKATSMLKKSGFQLYNDVTPDFMSGVVKSQTDADLVYACRIKSDGSYSCCTQNLNVCGGLRGSICKHLLVLIIGLVQAEKLDPNTIDGWVAKSNTTKPVLDKEIMGEIFIRYKGAEAGEVDWRPTETMPEDYYAL